MKPSSSFLSLALLLVAVPSYGQTVTPTGNGPFSTLANGLSMAPNSGRDQLRIKRVGTQPFYPRQLRVPGQLVAMAQADYSLNSMFGVWSSAVELDGISTGNDLMTLDAAGRLDLGNRWGALLYSITNESPLGDPANPITGQVDPGAHVLSHVVQTSTGIWPGLLGVTQLAQTPQDMGLHFGPVARPELDGMDFAIPLLAMNLGATNGVLFVNPNEFYFSVTRDSANALASHSAGNYFGTQVASGAGIYKISYVPTGLGRYAWSAPVVFASPADLGLDAQADEVDAIAVNGPMGTAIFSTELGLPHGVNQLQSFQVAAGGATTVTTLVNANGGGVSGEAKLTDEDDIDALCGIDPEGAQYSRWVGTPISFSAASPPANKGLSLSVARTSDVPGSRVEPITELVLDVSGWADLAPMDGVVEFFYASSGGPWQGLGSTPRLATDDKASLRYYVPPTTFGRTITITAHFIPTGGVPRAWSWESIIEL